MTEYKDEELDSAFLELEIRSAGFYLNRAMDVKAKARLNKYPATGINQKHFDEYLAFSEKHSMLFWVIFVDEMLMAVYGNEIAELEKERVVEGRKYPFVLPTKGQPVRVWPLEAMKQIGTIDSETQEKLFGLSQRNYAYQSAIAQPTFEGAQ